MFLLQLRRHSGLVTRVVKPPSVCCSGHGGPSQAPFSNLAIFLFFGGWNFNPRLQGSHNERTGIMTRRSCAIYATGIVSAHLLIVGIALVVAQVFQTMIHERLKKVSFRLYVLVSVMSRVISASTFLHFVTFRGFNVILQLHPERAASRW